jgi:hypothetical protein
MFAGGFPLAVKIADSKGRIALGPQFANKPVIIEKVDDTEVRVIAAEVVPQRELWLHRNVKARDSVHRGLAEAKARKFSRNPPDLDADESLTESLDD